MTRTKIQIRWSDIDQLGHVYNGQYQHFYDMAKTQYFDEVLEIGSSWFTSGEGLITAQTLNNYYASIMIDDEIEIETEIKTIGNKSITLLQRIVNSKTGEIMSDSQTILVGYNPNTKATFRIPDLWLSKLLKQLCENK